MSTSGLRASLKNVFAYETILSAYIIAELTYFNVFSFHRVQIFNDEIRNLSEWKPR